MKKYILLLFLLPLFSACNNDDGRNGNPFLPNYSFAIDINKDLPLYSPLNFTGNPVFLSQESTGAGINGVIVMNTGSGYSAFEATCPNQNITSCSVLEIDGINAVCPCDNVEYSLFNGQGAGVQYPLKGYRVEVLSQNVIRISN